MPAMVLVLTPSVVLIVDPTLPMLWQLLQGPASEDIQNYLSNCNVPNIMLSNGNQ